MRSDIELMLKAKAGSKVAFEWLMKRHHKSVLNFFYWRLWDKELAEDFTQDVFLKLFASLSEYQPQGPFKSYLFSIATNYLIDHFRRVKSRPTAVSLDQQRPDSQSGDGHPPALVDRLVATNDAVGARLERDELLERLKAALSNLPQEQYDVFVMHRIEGKKYEQIAVALGVPVGTVKSRMNAAYKRLQECIEPHGTPTTSPDSGSSGRLRRKTGRVKSATGKLLVVSNRGDQLANLDAGDNTH